jgi:uncharacterized protein (TIGR00255 family)
MTGFATAESSAASFRIVWELRSVNHRFLELAVRVPEELRSIEGECRDLVAAALKRGKVDCTLKIIAADGAPARTTLASDAVEALRGLQEQALTEFPGAQPLSVSEVLRWPGVLQEPQHELATLGQPAKRCLESAIDALQRARHREGMRIGALLEQRVLAIDGLLAGVKPLLDDTQRRHLDKLRDRLARLAIDVQPERLDQEIALLAQRLDVTEEVDRLGGHISEIRAILLRDEPIGRRLDFLIQELNREANTLASKVQDEALTRAAVDLKVLIEQMREQVQNLE